MTGQAHLLEDERCAEAVATLQRVLQPPQPQPQQQQQSQQQSQRQSQQPSQPQHQPQRQSTLEPSAHRGTPSTRPQTGSEALAPLGTSEREPTVSHHFILLSTAVR